MSEDRVVVFGGSGFVGSHVADALSDAGYRVTIFDRRPSPYLRESQEMVTGDLMDLPAVIAAARKCRYVFNFAGVADIKHASDHPVDTATLNVLGNVHTLEAARLAEADRFVFASTVYVYSESGSFYRASKQAAERFVEIYRERYKLPFTVLRYGSLYGRRADERNGIYNLLTQAVEKKTITYNGDPDSMREYIHVSDAAKLSVKILEPEFQDRHIIVTGHERLEVRKLMRMISEMLPGGLEIRFGKEKLAGHYTMTPYAFNPKIGHKLITTDHVDLGQGLLDCIAEIHEKIHRRDTNSAEGDWILAGDDMNT